MLRGLFSAMLWFCGLATTALAAPTADVTVVSEGAYAPAGTTQLVVHSVRLKRDFTIVVSAPTGPFVRSGGKLPAIYALDGGYGMAGPVAQMLSWAGAISPAYTVAIGYPDGQGDFRDTDYLYQPITRDGKTTGGEGATFAAFLAKDLRPFLEARYPLDPTKAILFGHSYGGLFAANTLVQTPDAYSGYVIASAAAYRDPGLIEKLAASPKGHGQRIFIAAAQNEEPKMITAAEQIAAALSRPESGFVVEKRIYEDATHISYYPSLVVDGFTWLLPIPTAAAQTHVAISLAPTALDRFLGVYKLSDGRTATITRQGGQLYFTLTGYPAGPIAPESSRRFFAVGLPAGFDVTFTFEGPERSAASAVVMNTNGVELRGVR